MACTPDRTFSLEPLLYKTIYPGIPLPKFNVCDITSSTKHKLIFLISQKTLLWYQDNKLFKQMTAVSGRGSQADKQKEGDQTTPLGLFYITHKNQNSSFYRSLGISYPNEEDASRGLKAGLINLKQFQAIRNAIKEKRTPPQDTGLGSHIMLHGEPNSLNSLDFLGRLKSKALSMMDWTNGCVAVSNEDMLPLFENVEVQSSITILP